MRKLNATEPILLENVVLNGTETVVYHIALRSVQLELIRLDDQTGATIKEDKIQMKKKQILPSA